MFYQIMATALLLPKGFAEKAPKSFLLGKWSCFFCSQNPEAPDSPSHLSKSKTNAIIGKKKETGAEATALCAKVSHFFSELGGEEDR